MLEWERTSSSNATCTHIGTSYEVNIYIDLPCIGSNTLDSVCSLIILITVRFTGILTFTRRELRNFRSLSYGRSL